MKKCYKCQETKPLTEFNRNKHRKDGLQNWCRDCNRIRSKRYYIENSDEHKQNIIKRKRKNIKDIVEKIKEIKQKNGCALCDENEPICLDFHHLSDKEGNISKIKTRNWSWKRVVREIEKCVLVCSNCHRKIHIGLKQVNESMLVKLPL